MKRADSADAAELVFALRYDMPDRRVGMLMFKRAQLYIGFALAALAEIIVRAAMR